MPNAKPVRVGLYARVSTLDQDPATQLLDLRRYCKERGWEIVGEFIDHGVSGIAPKRPQLKALMELARKKKVDVVLVWRFDRYARSVRELVEGLSALRELDVAFVSYQESIDTSSSLGAAIFAICGAMAELERNIIIERVRAGIRRAKSDGVKIGRSKTALNMEKLKELRASGCSVRNIAEKMDVPKSVVGRAIQRL